MFPNTGSLFGKMNQLSSICLNDTIPMRNLGFKLLQGVFLLFFFFLTASRQGKNKTKQNPRPWSCVQIISSSQVASHLCGVSFFPYILALWGFGYLMLPAVHVLLLFSSVKHIIQCKCWKNRSALWCHLWNLLGS